MKILKFDDYSSCFFYLLEEHLYSKIYYILKNFFFSKKLKFLKNFFFRRSLSLMSTSIGQASDIKNT